MGVIVLLYKLFQYRADLAAILKRSCCHGNVTYTFTLTTIRVLTCSLIQIKEHVIACFANYLFKTVTMYNDVVALCAPTNGLPHRDRVGITRGY